MRIPLVAFACILLLSGCTETPKSLPPSKSGPTGASGLALNATAPVWQLGQYWTYDLVAASGDDFPPATYVVGENNTDHYVLDATQRLQAGFDAEDDVSFVGPILKKDLSGAQRGAKVEFFRFPIVVGSSWTTRWDNVDRKISVTGGEDSVYSFEAVEDGKPRVRYTLDLEAGFFGSMDFLDDGGQSAFAMKLTSTGFEYSGPLVRATVSPLFSSKGSGPGHVIGTEFTVEAGTSELVVRHVRACAGNTGAWNLNIAPQDGQNATTTHVNEHGSCPDTNQVDTVFGLPRAGDWMVQGSWNFADAADSYELAIFSRTYTERLLP